MKSHQHNYNLVWIALKSSSASQTRRSTLNYPSLPSGDAALMNETEADNNDFDGLFFFAELE